MILPSNLDLSLKGNYSKCFFIKKLRFIWKVSIFVDASDIIVV